MSKKSVRPATRPQPSRRQAAADCINGALEKSDGAEICHAIGAASRLYNISDLAQKSGLARPSIHRAFAGDPIKPNFTTVLNVLDARYCHDPIVAQRRKGLGGRNAQSISGLDVAWRCDLLSPL